MRPVSGVDHVYVWLCALLFVIQVDSKCLFVCPPAPIIIIIIREMQEKNKQTNPNKYWTKFFETINLINKNQWKHIYRTGSLASRGSDESKSRRVFGSLLRRHTSFGATDNNAKMFTTNRTAESSVSHEQSNDE